MVATSAFATTHPAAANKGVSSPTGIALVVVGAVLLVVVIVLLSVFLTRAAQQRQAVKHAMQRGPALAGGLGVASSTNVIAGPLVNLPSTGFPANLLANVQLPPLAQGAAPVQTARPAPLGLTPSLAAIAQGRPSPPQPPRQFMGGNLEPMAVGRKSHWSTPSAEVVGAVQDSPLDTFFGGGAPPPVSYPTPRVVTAQEATDLVTSHGADVIVVVVSDGCGACIRLKQRLQGFLDQGQLTGREFVLLPLEEARRSTHFTVASMPTAFRVHKGKVQQGRVGLDEDPAATLAFYTS